MDLILTDVEIRVVGCLMEKSYTTPDNYPLSLNSLTNACNQKSNRTPVVSFDDKTVVRGLEGLREKQFVVQSASSRVMKYAENFVAVRNLIDAEAALLTILFLRGPQTAGELRGRTERLYKFDDVDDVFDVLGNLEDSGYLSQLPKQPGRKEHRYAHLLSGEPVIVEENHQPPVDPLVLEVRAEDERISSLEEEVSSLRQQLDDLQSQFHKFKSEFE
jgi:uncharacterized protein YceH (UPF0502 family)